MKMSARGCTIAWMRPLILLLMTVGTLTQDASSTESCCDRVQELEVRVEALEEEQAHLRESINLHLHGFTEGAGIAEGTSARNYAAAIDNLETRVETIETNTAQADESFNNRLLTVEESLPVIQEDVSRINQSVSRQFDILATRLSAAEGFLSDVAQSNNATLRDLQDLSQSQDGRIADLAQQLQSLEETITQHNDNFSDRLHELEEQVASVSVEEDLESIREQLVDLQDEFSSFETSLTESHDALDASLQNLEERISNVETTSEETVDELSEELQRLGTSLASLQQVSAQYNASIMAEVARLQGGINTVVSKSAENDTELWSFLEELAGTVTSNEATFSRRLSLMTNELDVTEERVEMLETSVTQDNETLTDHLDLLQNRVVSLEASAAENDLNWEERDSCSEGENTRPRDCGDVYNDVSQEDGVYIVWPGMTPDSPPLHVLCQFDDDGRWVVLQRRRDGEVSFHRDWISYKYGFGRMQFDSDFWLGLETMHQLTRHQLYTLRVDLEAWNGTRVYAEYSVFFIRDESAKYSIYYDGYTGTASDQLGDTHRGMRFSTIDQDNDRHAGECAWQQGPWWLNDCGSANLNGRYGAEMGENGVTWGDSATWKTTSMRMRTSPAL